MSSKRPGEDLNDAVNKIVNETGAMRAVQPMQSETSAPLSSGEETVVYDNPTLPRLNLAPAPAAIVPFATAANYPAAYFAARAAEDARIAQGRLDAGAYMTANNLNPANLTTYIGASGLVRIRNRVLPNETDPLVQQLALQQADVVTKINALKNNLTIKQQLYLQRRLENITKVQKGKKRGENKIPTTDQLQKVLFRALELNASRRAAQLGAQARRARRERHALQNHQRGVAMPDGTTVGLSKRHYKKRATSEIQRAADANAQAEKKALRLQLTKINKDARVAIARAHERKVNPKDLQPPKQ